ncbi:MAG: hypothetical protein QOF61_819 [Acidobacteriota bacterium]|nr:hypothetical protein [Acidobacteriota bacterium]
MEIIWNDVDMVEVCASASNGRYGGVTQFYTTVEELSELANRLKGFPQKIIDIVQFETGGKGGDSFLSLKFYCIDGVGHTAVYISMEEQSRNYYARPEERQVVAFELRCEAGLIDKFRRELLRVAESQSGVASLF